MKRFILLAVFVAVLAIALNDGGRLFVARSTLRSNTGSLASWASNNASGLARDQAATQLVERASSLGVDVYQYGQDTNGVQIWTQMRVSGLWVLGTYKATLDGVPFRKALGSPMTIRDYASAEYR